MRIYKKRINLNKENIREFFNGRGERINKEPLTAVLYQDNNPELAHRRDQYEREKIYPYLKLSKKHRVLDVGCGIGRWAEIVAPVASEYLGIDFSESFILYATEKYKKAENVSFKVLDALSISTKNLGEKKFDRVIIAGLLLYLNDQEVKVFSSRLKKILNKDAIVYLREPIAVDNRLSLDNIWSEELKQYYSAIYRTREELTELLGNIEIVTEDDMYDASLNNRPETKQYFFLFKYKNE